MVEFNSFDPNCNVTVPDKMRVWELRLLLCHKRTDIRIYVFYEHWSFVMFDKHSVVNVSLSNRTFRCRMPSSSCILHLSLLAWRSIQVQISILKEIPLHVYNLSCCINVFLRIPLFSCSHFLQIAQVYFCKIILHRHFIQYSCLLFLVL